MNKKIRLFIMLMAVFLISGCVNQSTTDERLSSVLEKNVNQEEGDKMVQKKDTHSTGPSAMSSGSNGSGPEMQIDTSKAYQAILSTTEGNITLNLYADKTPITVNNFVYLSQKDFYNQTIFHRTIKGFMIQGGDPEGTGAGGPGYKFDDEPFEGEYKRGIAAMANAGPNTNGSQFFIMHKDYDLPKNYVIFGEVIEGIDVVDKIAEAPVKAGGEGSTPVNPVIVESIEILEK